MRIFPFAFIGCLTLLSGCASIIEGTTQSIAVSTAPADGARCILASSEGTYYVTTPGNVIVHKTKNDIDVLCNKDGYQTATLKVESHFNGATLGNVVVGGLTGLGVDAASGANYNFPTEIRLPMAPIPNPINPNDPATTVTTIFISPGS